MRTPDQRRPRPQRDGQAQDRQGGPSRLRSTRPMALAGKMGLSDVPDTILTRSIIIPMQRPLPGEELERWTPPRHAAEAEPLCWLLRYWVELIHGYALRLRRTGSPDDAEGHRGPRRRLLGAAAGDRRTGGRALAGTGACSRCNRCSRFRGEGHAERGHRAAGGHPGGLRPTSGRADLQPTWWPSWTRPRIAWSDGARLRPESSWRAC